MLRALTTGALASCLLVACSNSHNPNLGDIDGGPRVDGGLLSDGGAPDAPTDTAGPGIEILSPVAPAAGDFSSTAIVVEGSVKVRCKVTRNPSSDNPVDSASVLIGAVASGTLVQAQGAPSGIADEYVATLDLSGQANGPLEVRCTASDLAPMPKTNSAKVDTFLDLGPRIDVFSPIEGQSYGKQVDVSFTVTEQLVATDDPGSAIGEVHAFAGGQELVLTPTGGGAYFTTLVFNAPEYNPPLAGPVAVEIRATNTRSTEAVVRVHQSSLVADVAGPTISIDTPSAGQLVGGFMNVTATVSDPAGVAQVVATMQHNFQFTLTAGTGNKYSGVFDTRVLPKTLVYPLLEIRALDAVGNEVATGRVVALDNRSPLLSLDSPPMREAFCLTHALGCEPEDPRDCSRLFDPLGDDAVDDGEVVGALSELRVRAEDRGNGATAPSGVIFPIAEVDQASVEIFVLDDDTGALLVDTDGDGVCDEINPLLKPSAFPQNATEAAVVALSPVGAQGASYFTDPIEDYGTTPGVADDLCLTPQPADPSPPSSLCVSSPLTRVIAGGGGAAIFSISPITTDSCVGNAFDAPGTNIADGWACVAARATDTLGNVAVSPPLRMCVDSDGDGFDSLGNDLVSLGCGDGGDGVANFGDIADPSTRPLCTDGCVPPESFFDNPDRQVKIIGTRPPQCSNGKDDDADGLIDLDDPECNGDENHPREAF